MKKLTFKLKRIAYLVIISIGYINGTITGAEWLLMFMAMTIVYEAVDAYNARTKSNNKGLHDGVVDLFLNMCKQAKADL